MSLDLFRRAAVLGCAAALAVTAGCSTRSDDTTPTAAGEDGEIATGPGVSGDTIRLGLLTDLTSVFASQGVDLTNGALIYWEQQNEEGGVCDQYRVELDVKDHNYNVQTAIQLYNGMAPNVLALQQTLGSPVNTALADSLARDKMVNIPAAWARNLTDSPQNAVVGATYDVEMINVLDYALSEGLIAQGDTLGHIYFEGELGANSLAGSQYFASRHGMTVVEGKIRPTDTDMSSQITSFKARGVSAVLMAASPGQLASVATGTAAQGLEVPILGNSTNFAPGLMNGPAAPFLVERYIGGYSYAGFDTAPELLEAVRAKDPSVTSPSTNVVWGYAAGDVMRQVLDRACENGDLTREGVSQAKQELTDVETGGLTVPIDLSTTGASPSMQTFLFKPADAPGALELLEAGYESDALADYPQG